MGPKGCRLRLGISNLPSACQRAHVSHQHPGHNEEVGGMNGNVFDRITRSLAGSSPRREVVRIFAGSGLSALAARLGSDEASAKRKKKRCRRRQQACGGRKKCCNTSGLVRCQDFPTSKCLGLTGRHCCGVEGARCDLNASEFGNCDCCGEEFFCVPENGGGRCRSEAT